MFDPYLFVKQSHQSLPINDQLNLPATGRWLVSSISPTGLRENPATKFVVLNPVIRMV